MNDEHSNDDDDDEEDDKVKMTEDEFWEQYLSRPKPKPKKPGRALLVVNVDDSNTRRLNQRMDWLVKNIFDGGYERDHFVLISSHVVTSVYTKLKKTYPWVLYESWQDLYTKLMLGGFFEYFESPYFQFAMFLNVRDNMKPGLGYGLQEVRAERCVLRAMFLASQGNCLFTEWGCAEITADTPREWIINKYGRGTVEMYGELVQKQKKASGLHPVPAFTIMLDHFLPPIDEKDKEIPKPTMDLIKKAMSNELFSSYGRFKGYWKAYFGMYFLQDGYEVVYERWRHLRSIQSALIRNRLHIRYWYNASSWLQMGLDLSMIASAMLLFALLTLGFSLVCTPLPPAYVLTSPARFVFWCSYWHFQYPVYEYHRMDRLTLTEIFRYFRTLSLRFFAIELFIFGYIYFLLNEKNLFILTFVVGYTFLRLFARMLVPGFVFPDFIVPVIFAVAAFVFVREMSKMSLAERALKGVFAKSYFET